MKNLFLLLPCLVSVLAVAEKVDRIAAVVNNDIIAQSEVEVRAAPELSKLPNERDALKRHALRQDILKQALESLISEKLLERELQDLQMEVSEAEVNAAIDDVKKQNRIEDAQFETVLKSEGYTLSGYKEFMKKHLSKMKLINLKVRSRVKVSDEDVKSEYAKYVRNESNEFEVRARHILVPLDAKATEAEVDKARQKAEALREEASKPGVDFAALAKAKSGGPSASEGGDLGFFRRGVMVAEFDKAAFTLPIGAISEPIRTKFGWHVLKVEERRALPPQPLEEVKEALREKIARTQLESYTEQYLLELRRSGTVEVKWDGSTP